MLLDWIARRQMAAFEKKYGYDMSYARDLLRHSGPAFWKFARLMPMAQHREGVPKAAWHAAKIVGTRAEACGPCVQLVVDMAREDGVPDAIVRAVLRDDLAELDADTALACRFARAVVARDADSLALREEILRRFGPAGLASLALVITASRMFPMVKAALGHGHACLRVRVGADVVTPGPMQNAPHVQPA